MRDRIEARYPRTSLFVVLLIGLFADYLCLDLLFFHHVQFAPGITAHSPWFWPIFGIFIALTLFGAKQLLFPKALLKADLFGLELGHRPFHGPMRIPWEDVHEIGTGEVEIPAKRGRRVMPAIRLVIKTSEGLGSVVSSMTQVDGNSICFAANLFDRDLQEAIAVLREIRTNALGGAQPKNAT
jgi:hypothetical protein